MSDEVKLLPCLDCGGEARKEVLGHDTVGPLFICANNLMFGGECSDEYAYLSEEAWNEANTRAIEATRPTEQGLGVTGAPLGAGGTVRISLPASAMKDAASD